jgi:hypothetical protein
MQKASLWGWWFEESAFKSLYLALGGANAGYEFVFNK